MNSLLQGILALLGFAPRDVQMRVPPLAGFLVAGLIWWYFAAVSTFAMRLLGPYGSYAIMASTVSLVFVVQGFVRVVVFRDGWSWNGSFRNALGQAGLIQA